MKYYIYSTMSRYVFSTLFALLFFSFTVKAQYSSTREVSIKGTVIRVDSVVVNHQAAVNNSIDTSVVFRSYEGDTYYLLPGKNGKDIFEKIKNHAGEPIKISGKLSDKEGIKTIVVESFFFL